MLFCNNIEIVSGFELARTLAINIKSVLNQPKPSLYSNSWNNTIPTEYKEAMKYTLRI